jgi:membrane protease YdiL (CAAX protease family)
MQTLFLALLLAAVFGLFVPSAQSRLRSVLHAQPARIWLLPFVLTAIFSAASAQAGAFSATLSLLVLVYTAVPIVCVFSLGPDGKTPHALDFLAILLLWLPLEFAAGQALVPRPAQGFLHSVAYGIAILLALVLFLGFRAIPGMKYNLPRAKRDYWLPLAAFAIAAPVLAGLGIAIGFIPPPHLPAQTGGKMAAAFGLIFAGTALPEEILFRSLIQNLLMLRFGSNLRTLLLASFIFGCAHLDNGPQPLPNWRYMILATVAGIAYGKVFVMASTVFSSAALHTLVDWTKHFFF